MEKISILNRNIHTYNHIGEFRNSVWLRNLYSLNKKNFTGIYKFNNNTICDFRNETISFLIKNIHKITKIKLNHTFNFSKLHEVIPVKFLDPDKKQPDFPLFHVLFYEYASDYFSILEKYFINELKLVGIENYHIQKCPTFRFNFPISHAKRKLTTNYLLHTDIALGHNPNEINYWIPLTKTNFSNSLRLWSLSNSKKILSNSNFDFQIFSKKIITDIGYYKKINSLGTNLNMKFGEYLIFDSRQLHCTQDNKTSNTRISIDIRSIDALSLNKADSNSFQGLGRMKSKFIAGDFFSSNIYK